jgi:hypothetical protein
MPCRRLVGIYDGATVKHEQGRVVLSVWVRTGRVRERVTLTLSPNAYADLQYVFDRGPNTSNRNYRPVEQKRRLKAVNE